MYPPTIAIPAIKRSEFQWEFVWHNVKAHKGTETEVKRLYLKGLGQTLLLGKCYQKAYPTHGHLKETTQDWTYTEVLFATLSFFKFSIPC